MGTPDGRSSRTLPTPRGYPGRGSDRSRDRQGAFCSLCASCRLRMGEEADVEILGGVDQLLDGTALALRVAEEKLGDTLLVRKLEQRIGEVAALQAMHLGAHFTGQRQVLIETGLIGGVQGGLFHIGDQ